MALTSKSLLLYGFEINANNCAIDFRIVPLETIRQATLPYGFYTLDQLLAQVVASMTAVAPSATFTASANRSFAGGTQNRVTISTSASTLELYFLTGPRNTSSVCDLLGFTQTDKTGSASHTSEASAGNVLIPDWVGYNYTGPEFNRKNLGTVNVSASGIKEAITFTVQQFIKVEFKHEPQTKVVVDWLPFVDWAIQQKPFEFTPEIGSPGLYYPVTLESSASDGKGLGMNFTEELGEGKPFLFTTGNLVFRRITT